VVHRFFWVGLVVLLDVVAMIGFMMTAPTVWAGIAKIQEIYSPVNLTNWLAEGIAVSGPVRFSSRSVTLIQVPGCVESYNVLEYGL
jgi:hypothetical protein